MKGSKKAKNNNANSMNEAQLESVQGGVGAPARGKQIQPRGFGAKMGAPSGFIMPGDGARGGKEIHPRKGIQPR